MTATAAGISGTATLTVDVPLLVAVIIVTPDSATILLPPNLGGDGFSALNVVVSQNFEAEARDSHGHVVAGTVFEWRSSDTTVATVDETGHAIGWRPGLALIKAMAGGVSGQAKLAVVQEVPQDVRPAGTRPPR